MLLELCTKELFYTHCFFDFFLSFSEVHFQRMYFFVILSKTSIHRYLHTSQQQSTSDPDFTLRFGIFFQTNEMLATPQKNLCVRPLETSIFWYIKTLGFWFCLGKFFFWIWLELNPKSFAKSWKNCWGLSISHSISFTRKFLALLAKLQSHFWGYPECGWEALITSLLASWWWSILLQVSFSRIRQLWVGHLGHSAGLVATGFCWSSQKTRRLLSSI